jgi:hypothetical protein
MANTFFLPTDCKVLPVYEPALTSSAPSIIRRTGSSSVLDHQRR